MKELTDDIFYKDYSKYIDSYIDYLIIKVNGLDNNLDTHKKILMFSIKKINKRFKLNFNYEENKMQAKQIKLEELFNKNYYNLFLKSPFGTPFRILDEDNKNYTKDDFDYLNSLLFPNGKDNLEIYEWSVDWSDYFDDGNEWWGSKCYSIYDKSCDRYIVIMVSVTD